MFIFLLLLVYVFGNVIGSHIIDTACLGVPCGESTKI
jgi:hypothetical protein